ncbi:MAG: NADH-quinone oxidoreductase subunit NuoF [Clostridia bacterium]|nr:NADH-quinone oxidoreductase subunit NuoF [Clostridia bacterium]
MEEKRVVLRYVGKYNTDSIDEFCALGGYEGLKKALSMSNADVVKVVSDSNLRGCGGAGFPTGRKWDLVQKAQGEQKYVVCNADESEPGTNKDRVIMDGDPHSVIEGIIIAGYAIGASAGYIYLRYEYPYIFPKLEKAIEEARKAGFLGENILNSGFSFDITLVSGGGAYVCGEETALLESIEGKRGEPRFKPPYPGVVGLYGCPTLINNVETLVSIPPIVLNGGEWYKSLGVNGHSGTKVFTLCGNLKNCGIVEYPRGINLKELIYDVGGGCPDGKKLLGVQTGGASGNIINADMIDVTLDIDDCAAAGVTFGTGGVMVFDETKDLLEIVENLSEFFVHESCGKCTPCREGNTRLLQLIGKIREGKGSEDDLNTITELAETMRDCSCCGLGQVSSTPVVSSIRNFKQTYLDMVEGGQK